MWGFVDCTRYYRSFGLPKIVLHEASLVIESTDRLGLLVAPGDGKSTIIKMLAGVEQPDSGYVLRDVGGWPVGYAGAVQAGLTGDENIRNFAQVVGLDPTEYSAFCLDFSELGEAYFYPVKMWSGSMRARLAFAASMGIPATTYLADDRLAVGNDRFRQKCEFALAERLQRSGLILVASRPRVTKDVCDRHGVVINGKIIECGTHEEAEDLFGLNFVGAPAEEFADDELASFDLA
jgi:ABC-type polysaccharide/polyol phosphate transport system ATPase subunit